MPPPSDTTPIVEPAGASTSPPARPLVEWALAALIMLFLVGILAVFVAFLRGSQL